MRKALSLLLCLVLLPVFPAGAAAAYSKYSYSFFDTFDTVITLIGYAESKAVFDAQAAFVEERFTYYHKLFDPYHGYQGINNLYALNQGAAKGPMAVPDELFALLAYCRDMQPKLCNTVNIAMGSVLNLWHDAREASKAAGSAPSKAILPSREALEEAARHTDISSMVLDADHQTVFFKDPKLNINLGAVAKGYAAEMVAQQLLKGDMPSFILNAGGNVRTGNPPLDGRADWSVALQDPDAVFDTARAAVSQVLKVHNASVVTSGDYQRYFTVDGVRYHHLISPHSLQPARYMRAVTIVTEDSGLADLLSTALFLMSVEEGKQFLKGFEGVGAVWILNDLSIEMTDDVKDKIA